MGVDTFVELVDCSNFPWILSNVLDAETKKPFLNLETKVVLTMNDLKVDLKIFFIFI